MSVAASSVSNRIRVAFYDTKRYDQVSFEDQLGKTNLGSHFDFLYIDQNLSIENAELARGCAAVCAFVNDDLSGNVVRKLGACGIQLLAMRCAGFDRVDLKACKESNISVVRVPAYSPYAVAEFATALLLTLNRKTNRAYNRVREGNFTLDGLVGFDLHGKCIGVVGTGKIGQCFIDIALGFGCKVLCYDVFINDRVRIDGVKALPNVEYTDLERLFREADVISLHAPLTKQTEHLINAKSIQMMKPGVVLINTSRGGLIDSKALVEGLIDGKIGGAGLDVYEHEQNYFFRDMSDGELDDDLLARLTNMRNVVLSSHQAFLTKEALEAIATTTLHNLKQFFIEGKKLTQLDNYVP